MSIAVLEFQEVEVGRVVVQDGLGKGDNQDDIYSVWNQIKRAHSQARKCGKQLLVVLAQLSPHDAPEIA